MQLERRIISTIIVLAIVAVALLVGGLYLAQKYNAERVFHVPIPEGQQFQDSQQSSRWEIQAEVKDLGPVKGNSSRREVVFDILVQNRTNGPLKDVRVGAVLDEALSPYLAAPLLTFGTAPDQKHSLIPDQVPYGLYVSRITTIPDPHALSDAEKQSFFRALRKPIKLRISSDQGVDYLQIAVEDIQFIGIDPGDSE